MKCIEKVLKLISLVHWTFLNYLIPKVNIKELTKKASDSKKNWMCYIFDKIFFLYFVRNIFFELFKRYGVSYFECHSCIYVDGLPILPSEGAVSAFNAGPGWLEILLQIGLLQKLGILWISNFSKKVALIKNATFSLSKQPIKVDILAKRW